MSSSHLRLLQRLLHDSAPYIGLSVHGQGRPMLNSHSIFISIFRCDHTDTISRKSREPTSSKTRNHGEIPAEPMKVQQHLLDDETRALQQIMWYWTSSVRYKLKMEGSSDRQKGPS
ncbi:hypothetical protein Tco_0780469 [Tanacetum coccineum]